MAKIHSKLQSLIDSREIALVASEGDIAKIPRRRLVNWNVRRSDGSYDVVRATVERMNRRAGKGFGFGVDAMKKVERQQKPFAIRDEKAVMSSVATAPIAAPTPASVVPPPASVAPVVVVPAYTGKLVKSPFKRGQWVAPQTFSSADNVVTFIDKMTEHVGKPGKVQSLHPRLSACQVHGWLWPYAALHASARPKAAKPAKVKAASRPKKVKTATLKEVLATPVTPPTAATVPSTSNILLVIDDSGSMNSWGKLDAARKQIGAIRSKLRNDCPDSDVTTCMFGARIFWTAPSKAKDLPEQVSYNPGQGGTRLYDTVVEAAEKALATSTPTLIYLLTDGENNDGGNTPQSAAPIISKALATGRITFACVGPASATNFFKSCGIPDACIRNWDGNDATDLNIVTQQATSGIDQFVNARKQGKTKVDSFFVDVVATGLDVAKAKKELRDITSSLRRRKIGKFEEVKPYVETELKKTYVPGAGYYQFGTKKETLKQGRRIILQPRGEDIFLAGPNARKLLGLPEDRDCVVEAKNLGDFVIYVQSASENRKLLPGTTFLYDESHVPGATEPTWSR